MIGGVGFLAYASYSGGVLGNTIARWEQAGVFQYLLPFLFLFALVYGILVKTQIFKENNVVNVIISLVVGLMALQFNVLSTFFAEIFPRLGIGLSVVLAVLIIAGLFIDPKNKGWMIGLSIFSIAVVFVVIATSFTNWSWTYSVWFQNYWRGENIANWIAGIAFIGILIWVIVSGAKRDDSKEDDKSILAQALLGNPKKK
ncbi:hypothetical protein HOD88_02475 [archaeon]|jgi:hypothetical protein|nr:hypothetical protein [archaeon]